MLLAARAEATNLAKLLGIVGIAVIALGAMGSRILYTVAAETTVVALNVGHVEAIFFFHALHAVQFLIPRTCEAVVALFAEVVGVEKEAESTTLTLHRAVVAMSFPVEVEVGRVITEVLIFDEA